MARPVSVIIPSFRNPGMLDLCLRSAFENQTGENQIIVVLDGHGAESSTVTSKYKGLNVIEFDQNRGQIAAHNTGVIHAEHDHVLIVNDDNVFPRAWDARLGFVADRDYVIAPNQIEPNKSIFKSFILNDLGRNEVDFSYEAFLDYEEHYAQPELLTEDGQTWPLFMSKKQYMMLGGIDPEFPSPAVADWDFFVRCELAGLKCLRYHGLHFYHFAGAATRKIDANWNTKEQSSFEYFYYKWGYHPQQSHNNSRLYSGTIRGVTFK